MSLHQVVEQLASCPLRFQPGSEWCYSNASDVLGYLIEVVSKQSLADFLQENIFQPLKMKDTGFHVPANKKDRFAACYSAVLDNASTDGDRKQRAFERLDNEEVGFSALRSSRTIPQASF